MIKESHHFYKRPVYRLDSLEEFTPHAEDEIRIYEVEIGDGMTMAFMVGCMPSRRQTLRVTLHGAKGGQLGYSFNRVSSSIQSGEPFVLFSDPTLTLDESNLLAWYLGTPGVNPDDWMEAIIRKVMSVVAAPFVVLEGGSGGGFVALRLSSRFSRSVAVALSAQTDIFRYYPKRWSTQTIDIAFPGYTKTQVTENHIGRARVIDLYTDERWNRGNLIHLVQNAGDRQHVEHHMNIFLREINAEDDAYLALDDRLSISRPYIGPKHLATPLVLWEAEVEIALERLKQRFAEQDVDSVELPWTVPTDWCVSDDVMRSRADSGRFY